MTNCTICQAALPDLLLDPQSPSALGARAHLEECATCREDLRSLEGTFQLLDLWPAPEPTPWFNQRLAARLREETAAAPEGFFERLRSRLLFSTGRELRPALAGALALVLAVSGGTAVSVVRGLHTGPVEASATVQDLQLIDRNDQALQTMDQLLSEENDDATDAPAS